MAIVGVEHLSAQIDKELTIYSQDIVDGLKDVAKKYSKELVKQTKATAPSGNRSSSKYRDSIKSKKLNETPRGITYAWYVDSKDSNYRLTHLIVHGHALRNGGRSKANNFLKNAVDDVIPKYLKEPCVAQCVPWSCGTDADHTFLHICTAGLPDRKEGQKPHDLFLKVSSSQNQRYHDTKGHHWCDGLCFFSGREP